MSGSAKKTTSARKASVLLAFAVLIVVLAGGMLLPINTVNAQTCGGDTNGSCPSGQACKFISAGEFGTGVFECVGSNGGSSGGGVTGAVKGAVKAITGLFNISGIVGTVIAFAVYIINYLFSLIFGFIIFLEAWIINVVLQINDHIVNTILVQTGFGLTLAIANLAFVAGIIIIAIATILRRQTYGIKQILWKLVVAAILVNFSLVIAGVIINFASQLSGYFLAAFPGQGGGYFTFANRITNVFQPQQFVSPEAAALVNGQTDQKTSDAIKGVLSVVGDNIGNGFAAIVPLFMQVFGLIAIVIVLGALIVMLLIRYVYLSILMILMPLAWVGFVFPNISNWWHKWWNTFIRWTFFAPAVLFFVWLVIQVGAAIGKNTPLDPLNGSTANFSSTSGSAWSAALSNFFGQSITPIIQTILQDIVVIGLLVGGLFAANSMSIAGAGAAMGAMKFVSNAAKGYAARRGKQVATSPLRSERMRNLAQRFQQPGRGVATRWTGRLLEAGAVYGSERAIASEGQRTSKDTDQQNLNRLSTSALPTLLARLERATKNGTIKNLSAEEQEKYLGAEAQKAAARYGAEGQKIIKDAREKSGIELRETQQKMEEMTLRDTSKLTAAETVKFNQEYEDLEKKEKVLTAKRINDDPEAAAAAFQKPEKLQEAREKAEKAAGRVPADLAPESIRRMQEAMVRGIATGLSPQNVSTFINYLSKANNLDGFEAVAKKFGDSKPGEFEKMRKALLDASNDQSKRLLRWNEKSLARGTLDIDLKKVYGLDEKEVKKILQTTKGAGKGGAKKQAGFASSDFETETSAGTP